MKFLEDIAKKILDKQAIPLQETLVILPNKRGAKFLQQYLAAQSKKPLFSPTIMAINNFVEYLSPFENLSKPALLIKLFTLYKKYDYAKGKSFRDFISWGEIFLHDIGDIDMQMADAGEIFSNLSEIKELETSFGKETLTVNQKQYLDFYTHLKDIYSHFIELLTNEKGGYEGLIYKEVACNIAVYAQKLSYKRYIFAGLSTLAPAEIEIINFFRKNFNAEIYFDYDLLYSEHYKTYSEELAKQLHLEKIETIAGHFATSEKKITEAGVSKQMTQIYYAIDKLKEIERENGNLDNTALVFADEALLLPFIHAYDCSGANLTMGFPLKATNAFNLLQIIIDIVKNGYRFKELQENQNFLFYHKDIFAYLQNQIIKEAFFVNEDHLKLVDKIIKGNKIFIDPASLNQFPKGYFPDFSAQGDDFIHNLIGFFNGLLSAQDFQHNNYQNIKLIISGLEEALSTVTALHSDEKIDIYVIEYFIHEHLHHKTVPFKGDFNRGLQIMGLLETRTLDFDNIIMLSVNEGILPAGNTQNSLILYSVRKHFNLPTHQQKASIYAFHFFRLLQRAKNIILIYNNDSSDSLAEKSRFINQLEFEIKNRNLENTICFQRETVSISMENNERKIAPISIPKNNSILEKISQLKFSASNLIQFISCQLQFYFSEIEKIEAPKEVNEKIEAKVIGSVIHGIMRDIFSLIKEKPERYSTIIEKSLQQLDEMVRKKFSENDEVGDQDIDKGRLYLATEITKKSIRNYLSYALQELNQNLFSIISLEERYETKILIGEKEVLLKGFIDRIDFRDNKVTILDYKTGYIHKNNLTFKDMTILFSDPNQKILFQLFMYAYLYKKQHPEDLRAITFGIISLMEINKKSKDSVLFPGIQETGENPGISNMIVQEFDTYLKLLISTILDPALPFTQTNDTDNCRYCDYKNICGR